MIFGLPSSLLWRWSSPVVREIAKSVCNEPDNWFCNRGYWLESEKLKVGIWIPNAAYGLYFNIGEGLRFEQVRPSWPERELIWRAVKRLKLPSPSAFLKKRALEILEGAQHG